MKNVITGNKLARLQTILLSQTDKQRLVDAVKAKYENAVEIIVVDPNGITLDYYPRKETETKEQALARSPIRVKKTFIEETNQALQDALTEGQPEIDFDSLEVLVGHLDKWVETSILGEADSIGEFDEIELVAAAGRPELGKFVYTHAKNGLLDPTSPKRQKRFSNTRVDIATKIADSLLTVTSLAPRDILTQILAAVNGDAETDGTEPLLFASDIILPVTHFKDGQTYIVYLNTEALDFYGKFEMKVNVGGGVQEPVEPEPEPEVQPLTLSASAADNVLTIQFNKPVEEIKFSGSVLTQTAAASITTASLDALFSASADLETLKAALVEGLLISTTLATSMVINFKDDFFNMTNFETLDTDFDGQHTLNIGINTGAFTALDNTAVTVSGSSNVNVLVRTDYSLTATEPHIPEDYAISTTQAVLTLA